MTGRRIGYPSSTSHDVHIGDDVEWNWGSGTGSGTVRERFNSEVTRTIDGTDVTRHAGEDEPAYLIEQDDGDVGDARFSRILDPVGVQIFPHGIADHGCFRDNDRSSFSGRG